VAFAAAVLPTSELVEAIVELLAQGDWATAEAIVAGLPGVHGPRIGAALVWLTKLGILEHRVSGLEGPEN
jgi:hypothetical protein